MAQQIMTWCDVHLDKGEHIEGTARNVALGGQSTRIVDLCEECAVERLGPVRELLDTYGRRPNTPGRTHPTRTTTRTPTLPGTTRGDGPTQAELEAEGLECPVRGCTESKLYFKRSSLRSHVATAHDLELAIVEGKRGTTAEGLPVVHMCDECEAGFAAPQGLGAHRSSQHGIRGAKAK